MELELPDLVPAKGKSCAVVAFDPQFDANLGTEVRGWLKRRGRVAEPNSREAVDVT